MSFSQPRIVGANILICDNDEDVRSILIEAFKDAGSHAIESSSLSQAWQFIQKYQIDCIICDISLDDGDGVQFAKRLMQSEYEIPLYLITGFSDYQGHEVREFGVEAIFFKPFSVDEIVEAVALKLESL